jgi:hypothetical protein
MKFAIDLTEAQSTALIARAKTLGVAPEELARVVVADVLEAEPSEDFQRRVEALLTKNAELYRRLA